MLAERLDPTRGRSHPSPTRAISLHGLRRRREVTTEEEEGLDVVLPRLQSRRTIITPPTTTTAATLTARPAAHPRKTGRQRSTAIGLATDEGKKEVTTETASASASAVGVSGRPPLRQRRPSATGGLRLRRRSNVTRSALGGHRRRPTSRFEDDRLLVLGRRGNDSPRVRGHLREAIGRR